MFVRFQSKHPTGNGRHPGVFALANGLARDGRLSAYERSWWRANNDWFNAAYTDPATLDASLFDRTLHPQTSCWFKEGALHLLSRLTGYLRLLDAHAVEWVELRSTDPGIVLYEDDVQVVAAPYDHVETTEETRRLHRSGGGADLRPGAALTPGVRVAQPCLSRRRF